MAEARAKLVGLNHIAHEVGSIDDALQFHGRIFDLTLRDRAGRMAFVGCRARTTPARPGGPVLILE